MYIIFVPLNMLKMKDLSCRLKEMDSYSGIEYGQRMVELMDEFPNDIKQIDEYIENRVYAVAASADEAIARVVKLRLGEVSEVLSLSYIARTYFKKSRQWLNQRINGGIVNGKPAKFTDEQLVIFNNALRDISKKIGSVNLV
jgi:hypothetical protein